VNCHEIIALSLVSDSHAIVLPLPIVDGLCLFFEVPLLLFGTVPSLMPHVTKTMHVCNSVEWKFRNNVERSIDVESEFFIQSLCLNFISVFHIDNLPFLVGLASIGLELNWLRFKIFAVFNSKNLVVFSADELTILIPEDLEPF
jgi:hypothetical protein